MSLHKAVVSLLFFLLGLAVGAPVIYEFITLHYIYKFPSAVLAVGLVLLSALLLLNGFVLDTLVKNNRQNYEISLISYKQRENGGKK